MNNLEHRQARSMTSCYCRNFGPRLRPWAYLQQLVAEFRHRLLLKVHYLVGAFEHSWDIGRGILERQAHLGWGKAVVETLAKDLTKEFPSTNSFSPDNLWRMRQLYAAYTEAEFLGQLVPETASERGSAEILGQPVPDLRCQALSENSAHGEILLRGLS